MTPTPTTAREAMKAWAEERDVERARILKEIAWALGHIEGNETPNIKAGYPEFLEQVRKDLEAYDARVNLLAAE